MITLNVQLIEMQVSLWQLAVITQSHCHTQIQTKVITEIPQAFVYIDTFIPVIMETSPTRDRLAHKSDSRNTFSTSTSYIQNIMGSFLRQTA